MENDKEYNPEEHPVIEAAAVLLIFALMMFGAAPFMTISMIMSFFD